MGLTKPIICEIAYKTWLINEFGCNNMYVLEGEDRALVVDAGMGYCNFREIVESLTDKPYEVVITHAHPDHVGMMHQFERIHIHRDEVEGNERFEWLTRLDFDMDEFHWNNNIHRGNWEVWTPTEEVICRGNLDTEIVYIDEGAVFDLGGRRVTAYFLPGHSPGHLYFVDDGARIAYTGDCVNLNNGTRYHAASTHIRYLKKFLGQYGTLFDRIFTGHSTYCGALDVFSYDVRLVENLLEAHRAYLRGEAEIGEMPHVLLPDLPPHKVIKYGEGKLAVCPGVPPAMWEEGEEQVIP